jgi:excinuclease ABC subunit C
LRWRDDKKIEDADTLDAIHAMLEAEKLINPNHPFLKLTLDEKFPRLLITRRPENKSPEQNIYGAFLPVGMARRLLDLLQRKFRLHPCELDIQGDFDAPCPEYFLHRCLAPCVEQICDRATYLESVEIVHLILSGQSEAALKKIDRKIELFAERLEYEQAAEWRDARLTIEEIANNAKWQIDAAAMNDVITLTDEDEFTRIHLTTLRRGKAIGKLDFQVEKNLPEKILPDFINSFYQFYAPKQIFVPFDFPNRKLFEEKLTLNFGHRVKIVAQMPEKLPPSVFKTQKLAAHSFKHKNYQTPAQISAALDEIKILFDLK